MPTCFEIYETYHGGPAAVLRLFEEALGTRAIYGPPDPDMQQRTIDSLSEEIGRLKRQIPRLKAALGEVRGEAADLPNGFRCRPKMIGPADNQALLAVRAAAEAEGAREEAGSRRT